jgi:hypothetical protein
MIQAELEGMLKPTSFNKNSTGVTTLEQHLKKRDKLLYQRSFGIFCVAKILRKI